MMGGTRPLTMRPTTALPAHSSGGTVSSSRGGQGEALVHRTWLSSGLHIGFEEPVNQSAVPLAAAINALATSAYSMA